MKRLVAGMMIFPLLSALILSAPADAWEIELRSEVIGRATVVRLGDVATISGLGGEEADNVRQIILAPGPSKSFSRNLTASQIRRTLLQRGVELDGCQFCGAARCIVSFDARERVAIATAPTTESDAVSPTVNPRKVVRPASYRSTGGSEIVDSIERRLAESVQARLQQLSGTATPWSVAVTIHRQSLKDVPPQFRSVTVEELETAEEGSHQLVACFAAQEGLVRVPMQATIARMVQRVVPVRPLERGEVLLASDVELRHVVDPSDSRTVVTRIDDIVGRQVQFPIKAGEPIDAGVLQKPILVKRRDMIEVVARRGGITVKMQARAIDDGAEGDAIAVERLDGSKSRFLARVVGYQSAEVFVSGMSANAATTGKK